MKLLLQFNNRVALSSCNRLVKNALSGAELFNYESVLTVDYAGQILSE